MFQGVNLDFLGSLVGVEFDAGKDVVQAEGGRHLGGALEQDEIMPPCVPAQPLFFHVLDVAQHALDGNFAQADVSGKRAVLVEPVAVVLVFSGVGAPLLDGRGMGLGGLAEGNGLPGGVFSGLGGVGERGVSGRRRGWTPVLRRSYPIERDPGELPHHLDRPWNAAFPVFPPNTPPVFRLGFGPVRGLGRANAAGRAWSSHLSGVGPVRGLGRADAAGRAWSDHTFWGSEM